MNFATDKPYKHDVFIVKKYGDIVRITYMRTLRESGWEDSRKGNKKSSVNSKKLGENITRARAKVREYALCNDWDWWCTFTLDKNLIDRYDLDGYKKKFSAFINDYNKRCPEEYKVKYLLVPEKHKDGAWHMHGFIKGIRPNDLVVNDNGYLTWKQYARKFGYISMDKIKDSKKASSYILKYITKDLSNSVSDLGKHLYYASRGLATGTEIFRGSAVFHGNWDWEHEEGYCKVKSFDSTKFDLSEFLGI